MTSSFALNFWFNHWICIGKSSLDWQKCSQKVISVLLNIEQDLFTSDVLAEIVCDQTAIFFST